MMSTKLTKKKDINPKFHSYHLPSKNPFRPFGKDKQLWRFSMLVQLSDTICFSSSTAATNNSHQLPLKDWDPWRRSKSLRIWEPPDAKPLDERTKLQEVHKKKIHLPHFANGLQQNDKNLWLETVRLKHWLKACRQTQCLGKKIEVPTSCCFVSCAFIWLDVSIIRTCQNGVSHVGVTCDSCSSKLLVTSPFSVENWSTKKMPETKPTNRNMPQAMEVESSTDFQKLQIGANDFH